MYAGAAQMDNEKYDRSSKQSFKLFEELIEEVLSRLPAKSLLRFRCVSQSWRSLIGSKRFIKNHLQNIRNNKTYVHWRVIYNCNEHGLKHCSLQSFVDKQQVGNLSPFNDPKNNHLMTGTVSVVGHCNGVLCIFKKPGSFFLWNPTTRISIELPKLVEPQTVKFGFGWDEETDAYKVFAVVSLSDIVDKIGKVYSTKTNSWKTIEHVGCLALRGVFGTFVRGKIYWLKDDGLHIETFDLNREVFGIIDKPCKQEDYVPIRLYENVRGCLSMTGEYRRNYSFANGICRGWVMEQDEDGVKESWKENGTSIVQTITCCRGQHFYIESLVSPVFEK